MREPYLVKVCDQVVIGIGDRLVRASSLSLILLRLVLGLGDLPVSKIVLDDGGLVLVVLLAKPCHKRLLMVDGIEGLAVESLGADQVLLVALTEHS